MEILICEDNETISYLYKQILGPEKITICNTGSEAIEKSRNYQFNLLILDIGLPDIPGWNVGKIILDNQKNLHVLVISALENFSVYETAQIEHHPNCQKFEIFKKGADSIQKIKSIKNNITNVLTDNEKVALSLLQERKKSVSSPAD